MIATPEQARFSSPRDQQGLEQRITELRRQYEPFLKSRPAPVPARKQTLLPADWTFAYEAKKPLNEGESVPQPEWSTTEFDDGAWIKTTVPEWRYRTEESDTALEPENLSSFSATTKKSCKEIPSTICRYRTKFSAGPVAAGQRVWLCFDGVDWEAQVWLNGEYLGKHSGYFEPFRFEVTGKLKQVNTLAVRVLDGPANGEPVAYTALFADIRAAEQRYTPDRAASIRGNLPVAYHCGTGFGIHRRVYLESSGPVLISNVFVRNNLSVGKGLVRVEFDSQEAAESEMEVELLPENFEGKKYAAKMRCSLPKGAGSVNLEIPMPEAKVWSPETPWLYRARVRISGDTKDVLFGCRSFSLAPAGGTVPAALPLLNGRPLHVRGAGVYPLHTYAYWGQQEELLRTLFMIKAANFNAVRCVQHIEFPEVRELLDRLGILSEQDQPGGRGGDPLACVAAVTRTCYNNPGVVFISFINEHREPQIARILAAAAAVDSDRVFIPISGSRTWNFNGDVDPPGGKQFLPRVLDNLHDYRNWYSFNPKVAPETWALATPWAPRRRVIVIGEFGAEALDGYETMKDHYPSQMKPPAPETDILWASAQVVKNDARQKIGLGRNPINLGEYIEASQNFQEAALADQMIGMRISPCSIGGYFQFHFIDVVPVVWPKSIVSFDHVPKRAFYQVSQINQAVVALPQFIGKRPDAVRLWVANDLPEALPDCTLAWTVADNGRSVLRGEEVLDVPGLDAVQGPEIDLSSVTSVMDRCELELILKNKAGGIVSRYRRQLRCVPLELFAK